MESLFRFSRSFTLNLNGIFFNITGEEQDPHAIFSYFLKEYLNRADFIEDMFNAIAHDAELNSGSEIRLTGIPGYPEAMTVGEVSALFSRLISQWAQAPGNINVPSAIMGDLENLFHAAACTYFHAGSHINIAIFGHTHVPNMGKSYYESGVHSDNAENLTETPCRTIYANSGTWVDKAGEGCTYVETEEALDEKRLYVRVKRYPKNTVVSDYEGFIET
ncbi:MAG: hypothetical protein AB9866_14960 [Syntrophobacteraceae bacterium]